MVKTGFLDTRAGRDSSREITTAQESADSEFRDERQNLFLAQGTHVRGHDSILNAELIITENGASMSSVG